MFNQDNPTISLSGILIQKNPIANLPETHRHPELYLRIRNHPSAKHKAIQKDISIIPISEKAKQLYDLSAANKHLQISGNFKQSRSYQFLQCPGCKFVIPQIRESGIEVVDYVELEEQREDVNHVENYFRICSDPVLTTKNKEFLEFAYIATELYGWKPDETLGNIWIIDKVRHNTISAMNGIKQGDQVFIKGKLRADSVIKKSHCPCCDRSFHRHVDYVEIIPEEVTKL